MKVTVTHITPLWVCSNSIRTCWNSHDKSDSIAYTKNGKLIHNKFPECLHTENSDFGNMDIGMKDKELIDRVANKHKHKSTIEHINVNFFIEGISRACFSEDTEVMTDRGYVLFKDLSPYDKILTYDIKNDKTVFQEPTFYHRYLVNEELHHYKNSNIDLLVTKNHRMLFSTIPDKRRPNNVGWKLLESDKITLKNLKFKADINHDKSSKLPDDIVIHGYEYQKKKKDKDIKTSVDDLVIPKELYLKLLAIYLSDGSLYFDWKKRKGVITISTSYLEKQIEISNILSKIGIKMSYSNKEKTSVRFNSRQLYNHFYRLGRSYMKFIPYNIWDFSKDDAKLFISEYLKYDGNIKKEDNDNTTALYTTSKRLADQLNLLVLIAGYQPNMTIVDRIGESRVINGETVIQDRLEYKIGFSLVPKYNIEPRINIKSNRRNVKYEGYVYCVSVPNETLYVRRKGSNKGLWCGNCLQELARHRIQSLSVESTRYTLKKLKDGYTFVSGEFDNVSTAEASKYLVWTGVQIVDMASYEALVNLQGLLREGISNDKAKYALPESYKVNLSSTFNFRSLQNFLSLRSDKSALWEIQDLAHAMYDSIPNEYKYLLKDYVKDG